MDLGSPRSIVEDEEEEHQEEVEEGTAEEGRVTATALLPSSSSSNKLATLTAATRVGTAAPLLPRFPHTAATVDNPSNPPTAASLKLQAATDLLLSSKVATNLHLKAATAVTSLSPLKATAPLLKLATEDMADLLPLSHRREAAAMVDTEDMVEEERLLLLPLRAGTVATEDREQEGSRGGIERGARLDS